MNEYRRFVLAPGQTPPAGSAGIALSTGWLVWHGEALMFPPSIESYAMTAEEIAEYKAILALPSRIADAAGSMDSSVFAGYPRQSYRRISTPIGLIYQIVGRHSSG